MEERRLLLPPSPQGGPSITVEEMPEEAVRDVVGNCFALRILAKTYAEVGNYTVDGMIVKCDRCTP